MSSLATVIEGRARDLGEGLMVRRVLPAAGHRMVGPFIFFDHMGPADLAPGQGVDVRPHPHIGLATVTYLFEGEFLHRDSLGVEQLIRPGDVNWMKAGKGIVHSERTPAELRASRRQLHGIQSWVALPREHEEDAPTFAHHPKSALPHITQPGATIDLIAGVAFGQLSPVAVDSALFYFALQLEPSAVFDFDPGTMESALYIVRGRLRFAEKEYKAGEMLVFLPGQSWSIQAEEACLLMGLGGAPFPEERHIHWNFVSSRRERIDAARNDWRELRMPLPLGESEFIPLPD